jgi:hypothetical protein
MLLISAQQPTADARLLCCPPAVLLPGSIHNPPHK